MAHCLMVVIIQRQIVVTLIVNQFVGTYIWSRFAKSICIVVTCAKIFTESIFSLTATRFRSTIRLLAASFLQYSVLDYIKHTSNDLCIPFSCENMLAIFDDHFPSHLRNNVPLFYFRWCCYKTVKKRLQYITKAAAVSTWLIDTITLYEFFCELCWKHCLYPPIWYIESQVRVERSMTNTSCNKDWWYIW